MIALLYIGTYFLVGLVITMLTIVWDHFMPEDFHVIIGEETLENHCIKVMLAWPLMSILYAVWAVIVVLLIVVKYTAEPFDNYLKRKR